MTTDVLILRLIRFNLSQLDGALKSDKERNNKTKALTATSDTHTCTSSTQCNVRLCLYCFHKTIQPAE
jgi:hypothetical protein